MECVAVLLVFLYFLNDYIWVSSYGEVSVLDFGSLLGKYFLGRYENGLEIITRISH